MFEPDRDGPHMSTRVILWFILNMVHLVYLTKEIRCKKGMDLFLVNPSLASVLVYMNLDHSNEGDNLE
jgi:hypothetical protein